MIVTNRKHCQPVAIVALGSLVFLLLRFLNPLTSNPSNPFMSVEAILPDEVQVGGLFERGEENLEAAFKLAIDRINRDQKILPRTKLVPLIERLDKSDSFAASKRVCNCLQRGVITLFGPQTSKSSNYVRSICSTIQMPHFETRWDSTTQEPTSFSVNLAPHPSTLGRALRDLIIKKNWKTFAILYSEDTSMILIQEILKHSKMHTKRIMIRKAKETSDPVSQTSAASMRSANKTGNMTITLDSLKGGEISMEQSATDSALNVVGSITGPHGAARSKHSFKEILKELAKLNVKNIIIDVPREQVGTVLAHAHDVNMLQVYNSYIFTTLDLHTVNLRQFYNTGTNISAFSLIDASQYCDHCDKSHDDIIKDWARGKVLDLKELQQEQQRQQQKPQQEANKTIMSAYQLQQMKIIDRDAQVALMPNFTTEVALTYDAIQLLAQALHDLNKTTSSSSLIRSMVNSSFVLSHNCARGHKTTDYQGDVDGDNSIDANNASMSHTVWNFGSMLKMYIQLISISGLTGDIKVNDRGYRTDFKLKLHDLTHEGMKSVAQWSLATGLQYVGNYSSVMTQNFKELLKNKTLTVVTLENGPYVIRVPDYENKTGNDRWEGYCVDLIRELSITRNFKYDLRVLQGEAAAHGARNEKGEWNGLIRELIDGKADIAVADLTITYERESVVDFTMPFMSLGIGILVKKPTKASPKLFEFMEPLAPEVWIYLLTAFVGVTLFLFMVARFSPYEWVNPHPCESETPELSNEFSMKNTLWFTIGCLMQQGCDIMPGAFSTRVMAASWWFFILILVSSYTANLAAFLTVERMDNPIQSADDLAKQTKVLYGCLKSGSTRGFFQRSNYNTYARMWSFMESKRAETLLDSNTKGVERVRKGDFAFLMESTTIEYTVERNCDLSQVGSLLDQKGYGIATQQDSPYRAVLSEAILDLQEKGVLHRLKERWWKEKKESNRSCEVKEQTKSSGTASELGLDHVGGVFVVLGIGMLIAIAICIGEFVWKQMKTPRSERSHVIVELWHALRYISCTGNKKPFRRSSTDNFHTTDRNHSMMEATQTNNLLIEAIIQNLLNKQQGSSLSVQNLLNNSFGCSNEGEGGDQYNPIVNSALSSWPMGNIDDNRFATSFDTNPQDTPHHPYSSYSTAVAVQQHPSLTTLQKTSQQSFDQSASLEPLSNRIDQQLASLLRQQSTNSSLATDCPGLGTSDRQQQDLCQLAQLLYLLQQQDQSMQYQQ